VTRMNWLLLGASFLTMSGCPISGGARYSVGGTATGVVGGGLVLEDNSGSDLTLASNGAFDFSTHLDNGAAYSVTVRTQPSNPAQTCTVRNGSGIIDKADVTNVIVSCTQTGRFGYVANRVSNTLSAFAINSASGALVPLAGSPFAATGTTPTALIVDPNGEFLYVANNGSNTVSVFAIDATTGALTAVGLPTAAGNGPGALTIDPTNHYLFVANLTSNDVSAYTLNDGALTPVQGSPFTVGSEPASLSIDPNGNFLYVTNFTGGNVAVLAIDLASGFLTNTSGSPFAAGPGALSIAIDPTDTFAYIANEAANTISEFSLNAAAGSLTAVAGSPLGVISNPESLAVDPAGRYLYAANVTAVNEVATYSIAPASGALTLLSTAATDLLPIDVAVDPSGQFVYTVNYNADTVSAYRVDASSGTLTQVAGSPFAVGTQPHSIAID
jgi:6-phosphogluconolactonase